MTVKFIPMNILNPAPGNNSLRRFPVLTRLQQSRHLAALSELYLTIKRGDTTQTLITFALALVLIIPIGTLMVAKGLDKAGENLQEARRISIFLTAGTAQATARELATTLTHNHRIAQAMLVHTDNIVIAPATDATSTVPELPALIEVVPFAGLNKELVINLSEQLQALAGIDFVHINTQQLEKNESAFNFLTSLARFATFAALFIAGVFTLVVSRRDILSNEKSIKLMKQMGATSPDIRRPFLYRCLLSGLLAGALSVVTAMLLLGIVLHFADLSFYGALLHGGPSPVQLILFFIIVTFTASIATIQAFTKL